MKKAICTLALFFCLGMVLCLIQGRFNEQMVESRVAIGEFPENRQKAEKQIQLPLLDHTKWLATCMRETEHIKVGMTRSELLKVFQEEGGLSSRTQRTYVYR